MTDYLPDGIETCRFCGAGHAYTVGPDGEHWAEAGYHHPGCTDGWPEECPF